MIYFYLFTTVLFASVYQSSANEVEWEDCGTDTDPIKLTSLSGKVNDNTIYISASGSVEYELSSPIQAKVEIYKKNLLSWSEVPCINNFGSCIYDDICKLSPFANEDNCPEHFTENNWPCKCPIPEGDYNLENVKFNLKRLPHWLEKGSYKVKVTATQDDNSLVCVSLRFTL